MYLHNSAAIITAHNSITLEELHTIDNFILIEINIEPTSAKACHSSSLAVQEDDKNRMSTYPTNNQNGPHHPVSGSDNEGEDSL